MYERSAIVLENYFDKKLGLDKENNIRNNYENYKKIIEVIKEYQRTINEEEKVIARFEEAAKEIETMQKKQQKIHEENVKLEEQRNELFNDLSENTSTLDQRLKKIEDVFDKNNQELKDLRENYVKTLVIFTERQRERNKYAKLHRNVESNYLNVLKSVNYNFEKFNYKNIQIAKKFIEDFEANNEELINIMLKNGKNERLPFDEQVIKRAVEERNRIAVEEAKLYISIYDKMKKLLPEVNNGLVKLTKPEKLLRDVSVKLAFLKAKKEYIVGFLDNERMTAMNGKKIHSRLMFEACNNFNLDIEQIDKLYDLIIKETIGKATKKAYKELYNKTYLKDIEEKEKDFEEEVVNIKINMGTLINANYWRIEGIKNIYNVFQEEVSEKFEKDLSEYKIEETENIDNKDDNIKTEKLEDEEISTKNNKRTKNKKVKNDDDDIDEYEDIEEFDEEEEYYDDEDDDFEEVVFDEDEEEYYDDEYYEDDEYDEYDEYYDDDYEDEEYDDEEDDITEEKIDELIEKERKGKNKKDKKNEDKQEKGLFGKLFKK